MSDNALGILALSPNPWHGQWVNRQHLLSRLARKHRVVYSTGGWFVWDRQSPDWRRAPLLGAFRRDGDALIDDPPRLALRWPRHRAWDRSVCALLANRWRRELQKGGSGTLVAHICHPMFFPFLAPLRPRRIVYHVYDIYARQPGWDAQWNEWQRLLLERADLVFCPTQMVADVLNEQVARPIRILPNGADVDAFVRAAADRGAEPEDLRAIPHPRVGYVGSIHPQLDLGLVADLATRRPSWHFVLIGRKVETTDPRFEREYASCRALPNVHFLPEKHHTEVPAYVARMDVNIMCYRVEAGSWTRAASPLKLFEYLASGLPVVSVDLPEIRRLEPVMRFVDTVEQWDEALAEALAGQAPGTPEARQRASRDYSWDKLADRLDGWFAEIGQSPQPVPGTALRPAG